MNNKYLFLFTISSVQSFIAQARKTQDLFAGSRILSELIEAGMKEARNHFEGYKDIFPLLEAGSKPNRFLAEVEAPKEDLKIIGEKIKKSIINKENNEGKLFDLAKDALSSETKPSGFDEQLCQALDIHWAFQEIENDDYATAYKKLEQLLGSIKNVRMFEQYTYQDGVEYGEKGRKCSLDGENNALFYKAKTLENNKKQNPAYIYNGKAIRNFALQEGEGLSAMSYTKRISKFKDENNIEIDFRSTAEFSLIKDESKLSAENKNVLYCFKKLFDKKRLPQTCVELFSKNLISRINLINFADNENWNEHFDYQYCFEENITKKNFPDNLQFELVQKLQSKLQNQLKTNHYAFILFDGDRMGKWLSGSLLKPEYQQGENLKAFHIRFSKLLAEFGIHAKEKILNPTEHSGQTVYAGGDDFLGFVNLHHLFEVIKKLRTEFDKLVNNELGTYKQGGKHLTFSAGIVIAHYKTPLSEVLKKAREVEKRAKNEKLGNRNAFAIAVLKHSGEIQECVFKWDSNDKEASALSNWQDLKTIFSMLKSETFSNKFITNLTAELYDLAGLRLDTLGKVNNTALFAEIKRLLKRALIDKDKKEEIEKMYNLLQRLFKSSQKIEKAKTVENFIHALHIVDFIHRKI